MKPSDTWYLRHDDPGDVSRSVPAGDGSGDAVPKAVRAPLVSARQIMAWTVANLGYQVPDGGPYRAHAIDLYQQDMHERIMVLFAGLDAQNAAIDAALSATARHRDLRLLLPSPGSAPKASSPCGRRAALDRADGPDGGIGTRRAVKGR
jgi:hypothetical protein